ncbi:hypothetical protein D7Z26_08120 [Cohnella endophytica]|uniref:Uncharacterized protein n=1 Tax=Cohnella endophytica TaxID=2419778 RepID=A0A494Y4G9_9BACL|nr:hypothetical protein [Cohnella endophytica]RKP55176.1 hypothetical protein D7Z26_08120 [Cohnella endophytica]
MGMGMGTTAGSGLFDETFERFLAIQRDSASGQRLEMLNRNLEGTRKLLEVVVWPALQSYDGVILEQEMVGSNGVKIYIDVYYEPLEIAFECDGFVVHAEKITRDRFDFEKTRIRSMGLSQVLYMPFSRDQLDKQPDMCRRVFYEIIGKYSSVSGSRFMEELTVYEREVIRYGFHLKRAIRLEDVKYCLKCDYRRAYNVITRLIEKNLMKAVGTSTQRVHKYELLPLAKEYLLGRR